VTNALRQKTTTIYDTATGNISVVEDPDGRITQYYYDTYARLRRIERVGDENKVEYSYPQDSYTQVLGRTVVSAGIGARCTISYDGLGRPSSVAEASLKDAVTAAESIVDISYDSLGRRSGITLPYFGGGSPAEPRPKLSVSYDALDRPLSLVPDSAVLGGRTWSYLGNGATVVDGRGKSRSITVDSAGRPRIGTEIDGTSAVQTRQYFTYFGLLSGTKDAQGNRTTIEYDYAGRPVSVEDLNSGKTNVTTNAFGETVLEVDSLNASTRFEFDKLGRLSARFENGIKAADYLWDRADNGTGQLWKTAT
jgi:YD repeat-containing protein